MRYIWNMGLSGSVLMLIYLPAKTLLKDRVSPRWRCWAARGILLYYLVPLTFLKKIFEDILWKCLGQPGRESRSLLVDTGRALAIYRNEGWYLNHVLRWELILGIIWIAAGCTVFLLVLGRYRRQRKNLDRCGHASRLRTGDFEGIGFNGGAGRRVRCLDSTPVDQTGRIALTVGILNPIILYPACREDRERELILGHELVHVRHGDLLWQILASAACILHCVNPLVWYLRKEIEQAAELYCDETVLQSRDDETRRVYAALLLDMAEGSARKGWTVALSRKSKKLEERLAAIMRKKNYLNGTVSAVIVTLMLALNSLTVFAYQDVQVWKESDIAEEKLQELKGEWEIVPMDRLEESRFSNSAAMGWEILYDYQYMDEEGNIYPVSEEDTRSAVYAACNHQYADVQVSRHVRNSSGGCTVTVYQAKRCSICRNIVVEDWVGTSWMDVCPH